MDNLHQGCFDLHKKDILQITNKSSSILKVELAGNTSEKKSFAHINATVTPTTRVSKVPLYVQFYREP